MKLCADVLGIAVEHALVGQLRAIESFLRMIRPGFVIQRRQKSFGAHEIDLSEPFTGRGIGHDLLDRAGGYTGRPVRSFSLTIPEQYMDTGGQVVGQGCEIEFATCDANREEIEDGLVRSRLLASRNHDRSPLRQVRLQH